MSFLDGDHDLTGSIFTQDDLTFARQYLESYIRDVDPNWLRKPQGPLAIQWRCDGLYPASFLINLALMMDHIQKRVLSGSVPRMEQKFRNLLRSTSADKFDESLAEIEVAAMLTSRVVPLAVEPWVPTQLKKGDPTPPSEDFGIRLPDDDVAFEVTVVRIGRLEDWDKFMGAVSKRIESYVVRKGLNRMVDITFPWITDLPNPELLSITTLLSSIEAYDSGSTVVETPTGKLEARWTSMPTFSETTIPTTPMAVFAGPGIELGGVCGVRRLMTLTDDVIARDLMLKSLRNTINRKRQQNTHDMPYVLVVKTGHHRLACEGLIDLTIERIWPNPQYSWMTGLTVLKPRTGFSPVDNGPSFISTFNPSAKHPSSPCLRDLMDGKITVHGAQAHPLIRTGK